MPKRKEYPWRTLRRLKKDLDGVVVRRFISAAVPNYDPFKVYIIYNGNTISEYDESVLELKKTLGEVDSYYISNPVKSLE